MKKLTPVILTAALLCGCGGNAPEKTSAAAETSETTESTTAETTSITTVSETTAVPQTEEADEPPAPAMPGDYQYAPPPEVLAAHFYSMDIEAALGEEHVPEDYHKEEGDIFSDPAAEQALYDAFAEKLPQEIVVNILNTEHMPEYLREESSEFRVGSIDYSVYDLNGDGAEDYYICANVVFDELILNMYPHTFERVLIAGEDGFSPVEISYSTDSPFSKAIYIMSTETNGLKDLYVFTNSPKPALNYDGVSAYGGAECCDEKHIFLSWQFMSDSVIYINLNISSHPIPDRDYFVAMNFAENPYLENSLLYTCEPDGTPYAYDKDYSGPAVDGFDFYVRLTDEGKKAFAECGNVYNLIELLEIKLIEKE